MANRTFDIEVNLDTGDAAKDLKKFNKEMDNTEKGTKGAKKGTDDLGSGFGGLTGNLGKANLAFVGVTAAVGVAVAGFVKLNESIRATAEQVREMENLARIAGVTSAEFQGLDLAAKKFGVTGEKVSDIIKDFSDKLGDATATGAGPFNDVIKLLGESSGLTLTKLTEMSGKDGIAAVIDAMEGANLTTQEQIFLQESLASDLSHVTGLFKDNASAIDQANKSLKETNSIITQLEIDKLGEFADQANIMDAQFLKLEVSIKAKLVPAMISINGLISDFLGLINSDDSISQQLELVDGAAAMMIVTTELTSLNAELAKEITLQAQLKELRSSGVPNQGPAIAQSAAHITQLEAQIALRKEDLRIATEQNRVANEAAKTKRDGFFEAPDGSGLSSIEASQTATQFTKAETAAINVKVLSARAFIEAQQRTLDLLSATTDEERVALDVAKQKKALNLTDAQVLEAERLGTLILAQKALNKTRKDGLSADKARNSAFADREKAMTRELALITATTDAERERLQLSFDVADSGFTAAQEASLNVINEQIIAQEKRNELLAKEEESINRLGEAFGAWGAGSKDAIKMVYAELIRLAAIKLFGGTGSFLGGFLDGLGGGGSMRGFAEGGNFNAGETFMVGEKGPEIITSSAAGTVIPNNQLGGGANITIQPQLVINGGVNGVDELQGMFREFGDSIAQQTNGLIKSQLRNKGVFT